MKKFLVKLETSTAVSVPEVPVPGTVLEDEAGRPIETEGGEKIEIVI